MKTEIIHGREYPVKDEHRTHYVKTPLEIDKHLAEMEEWNVELIVGKWIGANVTLNGGFIFPLAPYQFDSEEECQKGCDVHNTWLGYTREEADEIIGMSMAAAERRDG